MKYHVRTYRTIAITALLVLTGGLTLTVYDWHYACTIEEFRHTVLVTAAAFIGGILFEMVTGVFHKIECKVLNDHDYESRT